jgi:asparagine synthase (glutamine-hydrolysing)
MCGIVGIVGLGFTSPRAEPGTLARMRDTLAHRGPDGQGLWISPDGRVGLAHRRLSIVDPAPSADQPMATGDGRICIVFNGEIYNHHDLRRALETRGHRFVTDHSDTESLLHGYEEWGLDGLLQRLSGIFAFALHDAATGRTMLVRDHVGVKPLYFAEVGGQLLFASEIKAILSHPGVVRDIDPTAMYHYLTFMVAPAPLTMFRGIGKLPAGWVLEIDAGGRMTARRYWDPVGNAESLPLPASEDALVAEIRRRVEAAVERQMVADVPVGVFLSGGVDSSTLLALSSRFAGRPMDAYSVGFRDHRHLNEIAEAAAVAARFGARHHVVEIDDRDAFGYLSRLVHDQDEPIADWVCVPLHFVSALAAGTGTKVVLVGEGADEQFCGYDHYLASLGTQARCYRALRDLVPRTAGGALRWIGRGIARDHLRLLFRLDFLERAVADREPFWGGAVVFWESMKERLLDRRCLPEQSDREAAFPGGMHPPGFGRLDSYEIVRTMLADADRLGLGNDQLARMIYLEFRLRLPELLLMRVDKITMASSLEARVPFLDRSIVELSMAIPGPSKIPQGRSKHLLKRAVAGLLPDEILQRPKKGFGAPMKEWLRGPFGREVERTILDCDLFRRDWFDRRMIAAMIRDHREGRIDAAVYVWTLFNLAGWFDHWIARSRPGAAAA